MYIKLSNYAAISLDNPHEVTLHSLPSRAKGLGKAVTDGEVVCVAGITDLYNRGIYARLISSADVVGAPIVPASDTADRVLGSPQALKAPPPSSLGEAWQHFRF